MITLKVENKQLHEVHADGYVFLCEQGKKLTSEQAESAAAFYPCAQQALDGLGFAGSAGSTQVLNGAHDGKPVYLIFAGIGSLDCKKDERIERYRRGVASVIRKAECLKITNLVMPFLHANAYEIDDCDLAKETVIMLEMASYHFNQFITDKKRHHAEDYTVTICAPEGHHAAIMAGVEIGTRVGHAVNQARHWCDLPPVILTPTHLAEQAEAVAQGHDNLTCKIFSHKECIDMGMGGIEAVSRGSAQEARFIVLEYKAEDKKAPTVGLVGKGVTFDSGGLGIKPASAMEDMKDDMAGAASVIATMQAISHLKPKINIVAFAPVTENMTGGAAFKPGDVITHYNGVTSEVLHTDAEGRLILADALSYACKHYNLDALIDTATLTGACSYALGPFYAALMSQHDDFAAKMLAASDRCGDRLWPLPFHDDYKAAVKSDVADIRNTGKSQYRAGATTAGFFLSHFVDKKLPWIHLDVAGTSFNVPDRPYYRSGATGFGVRLFVDLLMNW